jgi:hypothetical protein
VNTQADEVNISRRAFSRLHVPLDVQGLSPACRHRAQMKADVALFPLSHDSPEA